jgi:hypothetical protein
MKEETKKGRREGRKEGRREGWKEGRRFMRQTEMKAKKRESEFGLST